MILVVDPGDTNGLALFSAEGELLGKEQCEFERLMKTLKLGEPITRVVVEDYRLRKGKQAAQTGSRFQAVQVIGALKYYAFLNDIPFELVSVQAKTLGAMYSGVKQPSNHKLSHEIDAYNIGIYWLVDNKIIEPPALKDL